MIHYFCPFCGRDLGFGPLMNATVLCRRKKCEEAWWNQEFPRAEDQVNEG